MVEEQEREEDKVAEGDSIKAVAEDATKVDHLDQADIVSVLNVKQEFHTSKVRNVQK